MHKLVLTLEVVAGGRHVLQDFRLLLIERLRRRCGRCRLLKEIEGLLLLLLLKNHACGWCGYRCGGCRGSGHRWGTITNTRFDLDISTVSVHLHVAESRFSSTRCTWPQHIATCSHVQSQPPVGAGCGHRDASRAWYDFMPLPLPQWTCA